MPDTPDSSTGRSFGEYLIHRVLGEGGMGVVYEAEERLSRRRVALKVLRSELGQTERGRQQFVTEMAILANLDDPHIVRCLHCAEIEGQLVMVLEHLDGRTLRELLRERGRFAWPEVVRMSWQIASALQTAHAQEPPVVHRDLKPENVMVLADGRIKVMDFGIAKVLQAMVGPTSSYPVGTLQYMSPEHIDARPVDARADLYTLGLVMWELLVGHPPFTADSPRVLLDKQCTEPAPPLPAEVRAGLPPQLEQLIARLLEKHPDARPRTATEVLATLEQLQPAVAGPAAVLASMSAAVSGSGSAAVSGSGVAAVSGSAGVATGPLSFSGASLEPARYDTISVVEQADRRNRPGRRAGSGMPRWLVPTMIVALLGAAGFAAWQLSRGDVAPKSSDPIAAARPESPKPETPDPAQPATPAADPNACKAEASHWQGKWSLDTVSTQAIKQSWVGGHSTYTFDLKVDGCKLSGSGQKFTKDKMVWTFETTGSVGADGTASIHYQANGRNIAGTWTIAKAGGGTWTSDAGDVSGTLTIERE